MLMAKNDNNTRFFSLSLAAFVFFTPNEKWENMKSEKNEDVKTKRMHNE